jgi:eukaryotic-like serine/threonine-protein kinase
MTDEPDTIRAGRGVAPAKARRPGADRTGGSGTALPADVVAGAARRVRVVALLYAATFSVLGPLAALLSGDGAGFFASPLRWSPPIIGIASALAVVAISVSPRFPAKTVLLIGLLFEVVGAYGIAAARYLNPSMQPADAPAVSWVAVWILVFAAIVPSPPRRAVLAALGAATAVPVMVSAGILLRDGGAPPLALALRAFAPYLLVVALAYISARVIYRLGTELTRARALGSYRLVERLGRGGMGEVWRAEHQLLARPAAIKLIRATASERQAGELRARFEREAQAIALLRSPHTIQLYDFGVTDDGSFYYVMELLDGFDLETLVQRFGPVPVDRALHVLTQVCHSLGEAHTRGLIHRDIKPANIFVCRYGREVDFVKVLDFGLVKPLSDDQGTTQVELTAAHVARGTPAFMAPEQAIGDRPVDTRADLYALGCLAYWLVTGQRVFEGHTALDTLVKHAHAAPSAPSQRTELPIPNSFDDLVLACLAKDPAARPQTADVVAERLAAISAGPAWTQARARDWWQLHAPALPSTGFDLHQASPPASEDRPSEKE